MHFDEKALFISIFIGGPEKGRGKGPQKGRKGPEKGQKGFEENENVDINILSTRSPPSNLKIKKL